MASSVEPSLGANSFSCPHCNALAHQWWFRLFLKGTKNGSEILLYEDAKFNLKALNDIANEKWRRELTEFIERLKKYDVTFFLREDSEQLDQSCERGGQPLLCMSSICCVGA